VLSAADFDRSNQPPASIVPTSRRLRSIQPAAEFDRSTRPPPRSDLIPAREEDAGVTGTANRAQKRTGLLRDPASVTLEDLAADADRSFSELFAWLQARGIAPTGPPFIRYSRVDMDARARARVRGTDRRRDRGRHAGRGGHGARGRYVTLPRK
jgi:hypothetical protein